MQTRIIGGYSILAIPTLSRTIGGGVGMAGCHTLLNEKRSPKSFDSEDLNKEGSHLLSRIALQYHRRKRA